MTTALRSDELYALRPEVYDDEGIREQVADQLLDAQSLYSCIPPDNAIIPDDGAWILVRDVPHTALPFDVPRYSVWRARRHPRSRKVLVGGAGSSLGGRRRRISWPMMLAEIQTPGGDLVLYPTEYQVTDVSKWLELVDDGVSVHFLGAGEPGELAEQVFYLRSRGLRRRDALLLLLPHMADERFVYLTLDGASS